MLILNADDLGRSRLETDAILDCFRAGRITSASLMVFMSDSERAARLARSAGLDVGLHLNFTEPFTAPGCAATVANSQKRLGRFLRRHRYAPLAYHPALRTHFTDSYHAQAAEFRRLCRGMSPSHVNGHHHMHLCTNMLLSRLVPRGTAMRRSFSFWPREKSWLNRSYRAWVDRWLALRYRVPDYFFDLFQSLHLGRLNRALTLARTAVVEIMTHPIVPSESDFLLSEKFVDAVRPLAIGSYRTF